MAVGPQEGQRLASVLSVVVMPFLGDTVMAERVRAVLRQMTNLRVASPSGVTRQGPLNASRNFPNVEIGDAQIGLAQRMSAEQQVDCVLFGRVFAQGLQKRLAGLKKRSLGRLYLPLVSAEGTLIWKPELPFTMVKGGKDLDEAIVTRALLTHVRAHAKEIGLADLAARRQQTASRSFGP